MGLVEWSKLLFFPRRLLKSEADLNAYQVLFSLQGRSNSAMEIQVEFPTSWPFQNTWSSQPKTNVSRIHLALFKYNESLLWQLMSHLGGPGSWNKRCSRKRFSETQGVWVLKTLQLGDGMLFCLPEVVGVRFRRQVKALKYWGSAW